MDISNSTATETTLTRSMTTVPFNTGSTIEFHMNASINDNSSTHRTVTTTDDYSSNRSRMIPLIVVPAVILIGLVGNSLVFAIMRRTMFSKRPVPFYLASLAVSDTLVLLCGTIYWSYAYLLLQPMPTYMCKVTSFIGPVAIHTSSWILVGVTAHRFLYIYFPHKRKSWYTRQRARVLCVTVAIAFIIVDLFYVFTTVSSGRYKHTFDLCAAEPWVQPYEFAGVIIHGILYAMLPSTILLILTICTVCWLIRQPKVNSLQYSVMADNARRVTIVLLLIASVFIISSISLCIIHPRQFSPGDEVEGSSFTIDFVEVIWLLNYSCNFYVSVGTCREYRAELKKMLGCDTQVMPQHVAAQTT